MSSWRVWASCRPVSCQHRARPDNLLIDNQVLFSAFQATRPLFSFRPERARSPPWAQWRRSASLGCPWRRPSAWPASQACASRLLLVTLPSASCSPLVAPPPACSLPPAAQVCPAPPGCTAAAAALPPAAGGAAAGGAAAGGATGCPALLHGAAPVRHLAGQARLWFHHAHHLPDRLPVWFPH